MEKLKNYLNGPLKEYLKLPETYKVIDHLDKSPRYLLLSIYKGFNENNLIFQLNKRSSLSEERRGSSTEGGEVPRSPELLAKFKDEISDLLKNQITIKFNKKSIRVDLLDGTPNIPIIQDDDYLSQLPLDLKLLISSQERSGLCPLRPNFM